MSRPTRLFRKLLLVLSSCMISSIGFTALYLWLILKNVCEVETFRQKRPREM